MCEWGNEVIMEVMIPANLSSTGKQKKKQVGVDSCIAPIVKALNDAGITTITSCCGHGNRPGNIVLGDKRELFIAQDYAEGRRIDSFFDKSICGDKEI